MRRRLTFWRVVAFAVLLAGGYSLYVRLFYGLGAATNLSDAFPWGLWIGFDVLCGVGLAAGGFTLCAVVHIFHLERFRPVVRPAILTAFLGYLLVAIAITIDIGRPWRIWHPLVFWNPDSVMFEVAWCVTLYTTVLLLEFSPVVFGRLRTERAVRILRTVQVPLVIVGVLLSMLHQSSLGSLYLIVPHKLHPFWYSPQLPILFFLSAVAIGFVMVILEATWSRRAFGRALEMPLLTKLGEAYVVVMGVYGALRVTDMVYRGAFTGADGSRGEPFLLALELALMVVVPLGLLVVRRIRESPRGLFVGAFVGMLGFILNRLNVAITGMAGSAGASYTPTWMEWALTAALVTVGLTLFAWAVARFPVFPGGGRAGDGAPSRERGQRPASPAPALAAERSGS